MSIFMTELDAVNLMLETIQQAPVNSLTDSGLADVAIARQELSRTSKEVQSIGWDFNTEYNVSLPLDNNGNMLVPMNTLLIDAYDKSRKIVRRKNNGSDMLYDVDNRTYVFSQAPKLNIITYFPFDELLPNCQRYVATKAARRFQNKVFGDQSIYGYSKEDEMEAFRVFKVTEGETGDYNMLTGNATTASILNRRP